MRLKAKPIMLVWMVCIKVIFRNQTLQYSGEVRWVIRCFNLFRCMKHLQIITRNYAELTIHQEKIMEYVIMLQKSCFQKN